LTYLKPIPQKEGFEPLDNWKRESEGGITLQYATPSPPAALPPSAQIPGTIILVSLTPDNYQQLAEASQGLIAMDEQNWWHTPYRIVRPPFPSVQKARH